MSTAFNHTQPTPGLTSKQLLLTALTAPAVEQCCKSNRIELSQMESHVLAPDPSEVARDTATAYAKSITITKAP